VFVVKQSGILHFSVVPDLLSVTSPALDRENVAILAIQNATMMNAYLVMSLSRRNANVERSSSKMPNVASQLLVDGLAKLCLHVAINVV